MPQIVRINKDKKDPLNGYSVCFIDEAAPITYITMEDENAVWAVKKIDKTSGVVFTYATIKNNPTIATTTIARTNRATLTYQLPNLAF